MLKKLFAPDPAAAKRVFGLDVLRAVAILIVVDAHATIALKQYYQGSFIHNLLPDGVELFFVLSGFLIGGILIRLYEKHTDYNGEVILNFWTRRWFRTLPNYYLVLGGLIVLNLARAWRSGQHHSLPAKGELARYFVFLQNFERYLPTFFPETWSLAIEEWSYLLLPVMLWVCHRLLSARWSRQRIVLTTILFIIIGTNLLRLFKSLPVPISEGELDHRGIVLTRLDAIAYGMLAAYIKHYYPHRWWDKAFQWRTFFVGIALTLLVALSASIFVLHYYYESGLWPAYVFYKRTFYFLLIGFSTLFLLPRMDGRQTAGRWLTQTGIARAITHISLISYSMYLLNLTPIMITLLERIPTTSATVGWLKVGLFWILVIGLSTLLYTFFEKPVTELRERFSRKEPKANPAGVTATDVSAAR